MTAHLPEHRSSLDAFLQEVQVSADEIRALYLEDEIPWVLGYSGGKDSTAVLQLVWRSLLKLPRDRLTKPIHVISTDTLVESPIVAAWVRRSLALVAMSAKEQGLPIQAHQLEPELGDTFWVNLIGRGYPAPGYKFRWCTERLKILPSNRFIRNVVRGSGEAILILGTRRAESSRRLRNFNKMDARQVRERLVPNSKLPNSLVYTPIESWSNDEVWLYLLQVPNPWGLDNQSLLSMYRGASEDNECPLVVDTSTPSCGNSRFGCWVCTLVERDRSMEAMIRNDADKRWMQPLLDLRNELGDPSDKERRDFRRMSGRVQLFHDEPIHGPYTKQWRERWLRKVLEAQRSLREHAPGELQPIRLIQQDELQEIRRIWVTEKHEFDDCLPAIYRDIEGEELPGAEVEYGALGPVEWEILREICEGDELLRDLVARLLSTEFQYRTKSRRIGIYQALERELRLRGFESQQEAVGEARRRGEIREVLQQGTTAEQLDLLRSMREAQRSG